MRDWKTERYAIESFLNTHNKREFCDACSPLHDIYIFHVCTGDGAIDAGDDLIEVAVRQRVHVRRQRRAVRETVAARVEHVLVPHLAPAGNQVLMGVAGRVCLCVCEKGGGGRVLQTESGNSKYSRVT